MSATIDQVNPDHPKRILVVASNPAMSGQTGWPIGFWWAELSHPYWEFIEHGYRVDIVSPEGGELRRRSLERPAGRVGLLRRGPDQARLHPFRRRMTLWWRRRSPLPTWTVDYYDAVFMVGGQAPMYTFYKDSRVHELAVSDSMSRGRSRP